MPGDNEESEQIDVSHNIVVDPNWLWPMFSVGEAKYKAASLEKVLKERKDKGEITDAEYEKLKAKITALKTEIADAKNANYEAIYSENAAVAGVLDFAEKYKTVQGRGLTTAEIDNLTKELKKRYSYERLPYYWYPSMDQYINSAFKSTTMRTDLTREELSSLYFDGKISSASYNSYNNELKAIKDKLQTEKAKYKDAVEIYSAETDAFQDSINTFRNRTVRAYADLDRFARKAGVSTTAAGRETAMSTAAQGGEEIAVRRPEVFGLYNPLHHYMIQFQVEEYGVYSISKDATNAKKAFEDKVLANAYTPEEVSALRAEITGIEVTLNTLQKDLESAKDKFLNATYSYARASNDAESVISGAQNDIKSLQREAGFPSTGTLVLKDQNENTIDEFAKSFSRSGVISNKRANGIATAIKGVFDVAKGILDAALPEKKPSLPSLPVLGRPQMLL